MKNKSSNLQNAKTQLTFLKAKQFIENFNHITKRFFAEALAKPNSGCITQQKMNDFSVNLSSWDNYMYKLGEDLPEETCRKAHGIDSQGMFEANPGQNEVSLNSKNLSESKNQVLSASALFKSNNQQAPEPTSKASGRPLQEPIPANIRKEPLPNTKKTAAPRFESLASRGFHSASQRYHREFCWNSNSNFLKLISSVISQTKPVAGKSRHFSKSGFVVISNRKPDHPEVLYQYTNYGQSSDFSYTFPEKSKVLFLKALKNSSEFKQKENAVLICLTKNCKTDESSGNPKEKVELLMQSISTERFTLKPLFKLLNLNRTKPDAKILDVRQFAEHSTDFEMAVLVEEGKLLYSKQACKNDWFLTLVDSHCLGLLEKQETHEKLSLCFDSARRELTRLLVFSRLGDQYHFQVFCVRPAECESKVQAEFSISHQLCEEQSAVSEWRGGYSEGFFDSDVGLVGAVGLFEQGSSNSRLYQVQIVVLDTPQLISQTQTNLKSPSKLTVLPIDSEDSSREVVNIIVQDYLGPIAALEGFSPELKYTATSFVHKGNNYYLMIYGVTGTNKLGCYLADRHSSCRRLEAKSFQIELGRQVTPKSMSKSQLPPEFLYALGESVFIDQSADKLTATATVAYGKSSSFDVEIDLSKFFVYNFN